MCNLWLPKKILTENGGEFENRKMKAFCSTNQIQLLPARTPTIQGLVERLNRTFKENIRNLIISLCGLQISKWCKYTVEASCIMNITYHRAINMAPYEAVFHMKAKRKLLDHDLEEGPGKQKRKETQEAQESYNTKMIESLK